MTTDLDAQIAQARAAVRAAYDGPHATYLAAERRLATLLARRDAQAR